MAIQVLAPLPGKGLPYGKAFEVTELGFPMRVHLYYSPEKAAIESESLYDLLARCGFFLIGETDFTKMSSKWRSFKV